MKHNKANQADPVFPLSIMSTYKYDCVLTLMVMNINNGENISMYIANMTSMVVIVCRDLIQVYPCGSIF